MSSECLWLLNYVKEKQNKNPDFHFAGKNAKLHKYIKEVSLDGLDNEIDLILKGQQKGRVILNLLK